eukprot:TRINITY_DN20314_c0_g1_i2.p1 TRINITY_DN20314_c0_g1~~TRINITY_DN20314_c0_g1_i2.p1  ORF type:complete len:309 (-),score=49.07 TRINITY_DN20314_c0_g1_i2:12-938(-)
MFRPPPRTTGECLAQGRSEQRVERCRHPDVECYCESPCTPPSNSLLVGTKVERLLDDVSDIWLSAVIRAAHLGENYDIVYAADNSSELGVHVSELRCLDAQSASDERWPVGAAVERLMDDVSDIWLGAVVEAVHTDDTYDVIYVDDGTLEKGVETAELRRRRQPFDPPLEVWAKTCLFLCEPRALGAVECVARGARLAATTDQSEVELWWCVAFHWHYLRCSALCRLNLAAATQGGSAAAAVALSTALECLQRPEDPDIDKHRHISWKHRCRERSLEETGRSVKSPSSPASSPVSKRARARALLRIPA